MSNQRHVKRHSRDAIAEQLERVQAELDRLRAMISAFDPRLPPDRITPEWIAGIISARRRRDAVFQSSKFSDPAWDILLKLYAAALASEPATITDVCNAAAVPVTTGLRWIGQLEAAGLLVRTPDKKDKRRIFLSLSASGRSAMSDYFRAPSSEPMPI